MTLKLKYPLFSETHTCTKLIKLEGGQSKSEIRNQGSGHGCCLVLQHLQYLYATEMVGVVNWRQ